MEIGLLPISASWLEFAVGIDPTHWIDRQNLNRNSWFRSCTPLNSVNPGNPCAELRLEPS